MKAIINKLLNNLINKFLISKIEIKIVSLNNLWEMQKIVLLNQQKNLHNTILFDSPWNNNKILQIEISIQYS